MLKSIGPLSFDSPAETDIVRRSPITTKVFLFALAGNLIQEDLPQPTPQTHATHIFIIYSFIYYAKTETPTLRGRLASTPMKERRMKDK